MTPDIAAYAVSIAAFVALAIGTIVKPLIESLPFANPANKTFNEGAHDALVRLAVVLLNVAGVFILCLAHNQLTWANWFTIALQVGMQTLGSHAIYQGVKNNVPAATLSAGLSAPAPIAAAVNGNTQYTSGYVNGIPAVAPFAPVPASALPASAPAPSAPTS